MAAKKCDLIHNPDEILLYVDAAALQQMLRRKNRGMGMSFEERHHFLRLNRPPRYAACKNAAPAVGADLIECHRR